MGTSRMQNSTEVSGPVLRYTNARQRNDLRHIGPDNGQDHLNPQNVSLYDFPHPRAERRANKKPPNLRIQIPSSDMIQKPQNTGDGNTIGIALGSPRLVDRRDGAPSYWAQPDPFARRGNTVTGPPVQRKPSKWQKIGGLFKARSAVTPKSSRSHYQVRNNRSPQGWSHSIDYQYPNAAGHSSPDVEDRGNCLGGMRTCLEAKRKLKKTDPKSRRKANRRRATESHADSHAPCLEVEIPDFHMERYSVMFGGVFGQGRPSLITRRSRTLDDMMASSKTTAALASGLEQEEPCRKQTPPPRSRTPSFNLFPPTQLSKASKVLGTPNIPRGPNSFSRCTPLPTENEEDEDEKEKGHGHGQEISVQEAEHVLSARTPMTRTPVTMTPKSQISELSMAHGGKQKAEYANTDSPASSPVLSPLDRLVSPSKKTSPVSPKTNPNPNPNPNPNSHPHPHSRPLPTEKTQEVQVELAAPSPNFASTNAEPSPPVEISVARSVSVSKGEKKKVNIAAGTGSKQQQLLQPSNSNDGGQDQVQDQTRLAPISAEARDARATKKTESQLERERILGTKGKTPIIMDAYRGHRHGNSHGVQIETTSMCSRASLSSVDIMCSTTTTAPVAAAAATSAY